MANDATRYGNGQAQWPAQLTNTLKELWATWTAGELCKLTGLTRNAIIGKAWRLKLPRKKASGGKKKQRAMSGPRLRAPVYYVPTLPSPVLELDFLGLTIDEIRSDECHYPHGGEGAPMTFCGQLVEHGSSYCPWHHTLTHITPSARRDQYDDYSKWRGVR